MLQRASELESFCEHGNEPSGSIWDGKFDWVTVSLSRRTLLHGVSKLFIHHEWLAEKCVEWGKVMHVGHTFVTEQDVDTGHWVLAMLGAGRVHPQKLASQGFCQSVCWQQRTGRVQNKKKIIVVIDNSKHKNTCCYMPLTLNKQYNMKHS